MSRKGGVRTAVFYFGFLTFKREKSVSCSWMWYFKIKFDFRLPWRDIFYFYHFNEDKLVRKEKKKDELMWIRQQQSPQLNLKNLSHLPPGTHSFHGPSVLFFLAPLLSSKGIHFIGWFAVAHNDKRRMNIKSERLWLNMSTFLFFLVPITKAFHWNKAD